MSPIDNVHTYSDEKIKQLYTFAHQHVKDVHQVNPDHEDFDKFLRMHPFYFDVVEEYNKRGLGDPKPTVLAEPDLQKECEVNENELHSGIPVGMLKGPDLAVPAPSDSSPEATEPGATGPDSGGTQGVTEPGTSPVA